MANNEFQSIFTVEFEDFNIVKTKLDNLQKKISNSNSSGIKLDVDIGNINKILEDVTKLSKTNIQILPSGQIKVINTLNDELGKTIKLTEDLSTGKVKIDLSNNFEKQSKEQQKLAEQMANGREKAELKSQQAIKKTEEAQTKAMNKALENSKTEQANAKAEEQSAKKLIEYEKEKLKLKQKAIELNRGSLVNSNKSAEIGSGIENLSGNNTSEVRSNVQKLNLELQKLDQNARLKGVEVGQHNVSSLGDAFKSTLSKLGIFASTTMVIREFSNQLREATRYTIEMDTALTNIMMITGQSASSVGKITNEFKALGSELHSTNSEIMRSSEGILRAGYDTETSKKMVEASVIGAKLSGQTSKDVTEQLIAVKNAFDMTGDEMVLVIDKMAQMDRTSATSFGELSQAVMRTAFSAREMGTSFEDLLAYVTTVSEKTRRSADTIGESFKSIYSRYSNVKLGAVDEDGKSISDVEKALGRLDIKIRDGADSFRDFDDVLKEFMDKVKSGSMSEIDKMAAVNALAGTRQKETLLALIENTEALTKHQEDLANSTGMAKDMFDNAYSDSLDAKINDLKRSFEGLYESMLNSSTLKFGIAISTDTINVLSKFIDTFGVIPSMTTAVVGGLTLFNAKFRESTSFLSKFALGVTGLQPKVDSLNSALQKKAKTLDTDIKITKGLIEANKKSGDSTVGLSAKLGLYEAQLTATNIKIGLLKVSTLALQAAMTMGISIAVSVAIGAIMKLGKELFGTGETMADCADQARTLSESLNNIGSENDLVTQYEELNNQLKDTTISAEEVKSLNEQIASVKSQLGADDRYYWILNDESKTLEEQLELMKQVNAERLKAHAKDLDKDMMSQGKANSKANNLEEDVKLWNKMDEAIQNADASGKTYYQGHEVAAANLKRSQEEVGERIKTNSLEIQEYNGNVKLMDEAGHKSSRSQIELASGVQDVTDKITQNTNELNANTKAKQDNAQSSNSDTSTVGNFNLSSEEQSANLFESALKSLGYTAEETSEKLGKLDDKSLDGVTSSIESIATTRFGETIGELEKLQGLMDDINESGEMTPSIIKSLASSYPEMGGAILDTASAQEFLTNKINETKDTQAQAIVVMNGNNELYYSSCLANGNALQDAFNQFASNFVDINGQSYTFDVNNYKSLNEAKAGLMTQLGSAVAQFISRYTGENAAGYEKDLSNFNSATEAKAYALSQLQGKLNSLITNYNNFVATSYKQANESNWAFFDDHDFLKTAKNYQAQIGNISAGIDTINKSFSGLDTTLGNFGISGVGYNPSGSSVGSGSSGGSGGSGGSGSSGGKTDAEKAAEARIKAEEEANRAIMDMRSKLVELLKKKYSEMRDAEIKAIDDEISELEKQLKRLEDGYVTEEERLKALEEEKAKWDQDNSAYGQAQSQKLAEEIEKQKLKVQIEGLEGQKDVINDKYDKMLSDQSLIIDRIFRNKYRTQL